MLISTKDSFILCRFHKVPTEYLSQVGDLRMKEVFMRDSELKSGVFGKFKVVDFHAGDKWRCLCECGAVNLFTRADLESGRVRCKCAEAGDPSLDKMNAGLRSQ